VIRILVRRNNKSDQVTGPRKQQERSGCWSDSIKTTGVGALAEPPPIEEISGAIDSRGNKFLRPSRNRSTPTYDVSESQRFRKGTMSDTEDTRHDRGGQLHTTTTAGVGGSSSTTGSKKEGNRSGNGRNKSSATSFRRNEIGIEELRGNIFTYGTQGQQSNYIRTKKAIADYVGTTFKFAKELYKAINGGEEIELQEPEKPTSIKPTQIEMKRYEVLCNRFFAKVEEYEREKTKLFRLIMGQCSPTMRDKLESMKEFSQLEE
jgi:hypothetical protein